METIQLKQPEQEFGDFMGMPDGLAKNVHYYNNIHSRNFTEASITKKEGFIYYSTNTFKVVKSTKSSYYIKRVTRDGFTIDEKSKVKFWFNKSIFQMPFINEVFKYFNFNWLEVKLYSFITKGIFEKMIAGKITNNTDVCKAYIKAMRLNCSPSLFLQLFTSDYTISKADFLRQCSVAKDVNHFIEYTMSTGKENSRDKYHILSDMIKEAQILEKKIDFTWSLNRLKEEHKSWTEQIMQVEIDALDDEVIPNVERFDRYTPANFKLLKTQKEVFYEGKMMKHCVYTAYWNNIKNNKYLAYHIELNAEEATLGVYIDSDCIRYNQCYSRYNGSISSKMTVLVNQFIDKLNEQVKRDGVVLQTAENYVQVGNNIVNEIPF
jgi:hypothetical protein